MASNRTVSFDVQVVHSVQKVGQEAWDRLGEERPFASYRWYRYGETVLTDEAPVYVILSLKGEPVARATFWLTRTQPVEVPGVVTERLLQFVVRLWPLFICHSPLASTSGLVLPDDPQLRSAALETIAQVVQDLSREHRASFTVFDYLERQEAEWTFWPSPFAAAQIPEPGTRLAITWPDFDSYLKTLSKKRRYQYRRHLKEADKMGVEIKVHPTMTDTDRALTLIRNVEQKYGERPSPWTRRLIENANIVDTVWVTAELEGRIVGCELVVGDRNSWRVTVLGRDYDYDYVYFLLGYADIRYAIEAGADVLYWGTCAYDVKQRLGFELESNHHLTFATNSRPLNRIARQLVEKYYGL